MLLSLADFFLPRLCLSCSEKLDPHQEYVCTKCFSLLKKASEERIIFEYQRKFQAAATISGYKSLYVFEKNKQMQQIIHSLKYRGKFRAGIFLGQNIGSAFSETIKSWNIDIIIPVPLYSLKKFERGYNQSRYIAKGINKITGLPVYENILKRRKNTSSQTKMNLLQRKENIREAFVVKKPEAIKDKNILLADDVITTGSTISECGRVLKEKGARAIFAVSAAIADLELKNQFDFKPELENVPQS